MNCNILFIERELNPTGGGVQRVSYILGEGLCKRGFNTWYAFHEKKSDTDLIPNDRKLFFDINIPQQNILEEFSSFIETNRINILFCQNVYSVKMCNVYRELKESFHMKIVACLHANPDRTTNKNCFKLTPFRIYLKDILKTIYFNIIGNAFIEEMKRVYAMSDRYVLLSKRFIPVFINIVKPDDTSKLIGINNPCSFQEYKADKKNDILLVVARMEEGQKRISNILRVWNRLLWKYKNWSLVVVGKGKDLEYYKGYVRKNNIGRVEFVGASDNVQQYYSTSKIFLMTSIWEGLSMTLIEAQSFGCVPVAFDNFAALHDIINGSNGTIVKSNDLDEYIKTVDDLMSHDAKLNEMSVQAINSSRHNFDTDKILDEWCAELNQLLSNGK